MNNITIICGACGYHRDILGSVGKLTDEEVAAAAYAQFGIVADDAEIIAFAAWVLEQAGHQKLVAVARGTILAWDSMFEQCAGNPIQNAWGKQVDVLKLNEANYAAEKALEAIGVEHYDTTQLVDLPDVWDQASPITTHAPGAA